MTGMDFTPYGELPASIIAEIVEAGLSPHDLYTDIADALREDLPQPGDVDVTTVATISEHSQGRGVFAAREQGVVAGLGFAAMVFHYVMGETVTISRRLPEGAAVKPGDVAMEVSGPTRSLLTAERTALNYACHLSGIATATSKWVEALEGTNAKVIDIRKTLPNHRALQKYAVRTGGGHNHRFSLADMALIKDNHVVAAGGVVPAYEAVRKMWPDLPVEVEVATLDELRELLEVGCERILLDNMTNEQMSKAVAITAGRAILEASGGLTLERARSVAETGVDWISVGALTHSVKAFDIGFDLQVG